MRGVRQFIDKTLNGKAWNEEDTERHQARGIATEPGFLLIEGKLAAASWRQTL